MKLSSPILYLTLFFILFPSILAEDCAPTKPLLKHVEEEWSVGTLANRQKPGPILTDSYEEMLKDHDKKMISIGLNNSGIININDTVVISENPKYIYDDGVTGKFAPIQKHKSQITQDYGEMLQDRDKKLISLQVNRTAFYDPDNQVVVKGTGDMPTVDPLDNYIINKMENKMETPTLVKNTQGKAKFLQK